VKKWNKHGNLRGEVGRVDATRSLLGSAFFHSSRLAVAVTRAELLAVQLAPPQARSLEDFSCPICLEVLSNPVRRFHPCSPLAGKRRVLMRDRAIPTTGAAQLRAPLLLLVPRHCGSVLGRSPGRAVRFLGPRRAAAASPAARLSARLPGVPQAAAAG
jgi:hypothetical protein